MKKTILFISIGLLFLNNPYPSRSMKSLGSECDVKEIYESIKTDIGVKAINSYGELEDISELLVPVELEEGVYEIQITRKGSNLYKIEGTSYYLETMFCFEFAIYDDAILKISSISGFTVGKIIFL